jgi:hypothetical protein
MKRAGGDPPEGSPAGGALESAGVWVRGAGVALAAIGVGDGVAAAGVAAGDAVWTRTSSLGDAVGTGVGEAVMTPAGGLEGGGLVGEGLGEPAGWLPGAVPGTYHCRLANGTGKASRSSASGTWLVVKGSGPVSPG